MKIDKIVGTFTGGLEETGDGLFETGAGGEGEGVCLAGGSCFTSDCFTGGEETFFAGGAEVSLEGSFWRTFTPYSFGSEGFEGAGSGRTLFKADWEGRWVCKLFT